MKIIIDAMGGDNAPDEIVKGALNALRETGVEIVLCGRGEDILRVIEKMGVSSLPQGIEIVNASEVIEMDDDPANAVRLKKDSSMTVALQLLRDGRGDALVSAGNTGALLTGATLIVKRIKGVRRAALAPVIPSGSGGFVLIDSGANAECKPEYLLQFALMGACYSHISQKNDSPRVGLLNNGSEQTKGTPLQLEAHRLLQKAADDGHINFIGNVEANAAMLGSCDVLVCDGFTGNVLLKAIEGTARLLMKELKSVFMKSAVTKLSGLLISKHFSDLKSKLDPDAIGGTALLGITKPVIKAHGSSNAQAIENAVRQAVDAVNTDVSVKLKERIAQWSQV